MIFWYSSFSAQSTGTGSIQIFWMGYRSIDVVGSTVTLRSNPSFPRCSSLIRAIFQWLHFSSFNNTSCPTFAFSPGMVAALIGATHDFVVSRWHFIVPFGLCLLRHSRAYRWRQRSVPWLGYPPTLAVPIPTRMRADDSKVRAIHVQRQCSSLQDDVFLNLSFFMYASPPYSWQIK